MGPGSGDLGVMMVQEEQLKDEKLRQEDRAKGLC